MQGQIYIKMRISPRRIYYIYLKKIILYLSTKAKIKSYFTYVQYFTNSLSYICPLSAIAMMYNLIPSYLFRK